MNDTQRIEQLESEVKQMDTHIGFLMDRAHREDALERACEAAGREFDEGVASEMDFVKNLEQKPLFTVCKRCGDRMPSCMDAEQIQQWASYHSAKKCVPPQATGVLLDPQPTESPEATCGCCEDGMIQTPTEINGQAEVEWVKCPHCRPEASGQTEAVRTPCEFCGAKLGNNEVIGLWIEHHNKALAFDKLCEIYSEEERPKTIFHTVKAFQRDMAMLKRLLADAVEKPAMTVLRNGDVNKSEVVERICGPLSNRII